MSDPPCVLPWRTHQTFGMRGNRHRLSLGMQGSHRPTGRALHFCHCSTRDLVWLQPRHPGKGAPHRWQGLRRSPHRALRYVRLLDRNRPLPDTRPHGPRPARPFWQGCSLRHDIIAHPQLINEHEPIPALNPGPRKNC
jgi:hypothetical protein